jgi:cupin superfamily acireductone dioxygenase involved in methionine salvage
MMRDELAAIIAQAENAHVELGSRAEFDVFDLMGFIQNNPELNEKFEKIVREAGHDDDMWAYFEDVLPKYGLVE